jgi:hypothetical protein
LTALLTLYPTLDTCIETQAKREYNRLLSLLLKSPEDADLQARLETVKAFLEQADFNRLRAESEPLLIQGRKVTFEVWREDGTAKWRMEVSG